MNDKYTVTVYHELMTVNVISNK